MVCLTTVGAAVCSDQCRTFKCVLSVDSWCRCTVVINVEPLRVFSLSTVGAAVCSDQC